jgi:hypothetical protein
MARWIMILGVILLAIGAMLQFAPWMFNWFGKLPGDIRIETERIKIFVPITSMVLLSIVLTLLLNFLKR